MLKKLNIKWHDWLIIAGVMIMVLINPLAGAFIIEAIIYLFEQLILFYDIALAVGATMVVIGFIVGKVEANKAEKKRLKTLKKKPSKPTAGNYIATI